MSNPENDERSHECSFVIRPVANGLGSLRFVPRPARVSAVVEQRWSAFVPHVVCGFGCAGVSRAPLRGPQRVSVKRCRCDDVGLFGPGNLSEVGRLEASRVVRVEGHVAIEIAPCQLPVASAGSFLTCFLNDAPQQFGAVGKRQCVVVLRGKSTCCPADGAGRRTCSGDRALPTIDAQIGDAWSAIHRGRGNAILIGTGHLDASVTALRNGVAAHTRTAATEATRTPRPSSRAYGGRFITDLLRTVESRLARAVARA